MNVAPGATTSAVVHSAAIPVVHVHPGPSAVTDAKLLGSSAIGRTMVLPVVGTGPWLVTMTVNELATPAVYAPSGRTSSVSSNVGAAKTMLARRRKAPGVSPEEDTEQREGHNRGSALVHRVNRTGTPGLPRSLIS